MKDNKASAVILDLLSLEMETHVSEGTRYAGSYTGLAADQARELGFNVSILEPGCFSCPYHFHHAEEELFLVLQGEATLRTPEGFRVMKAGELAFFPTGPGGSHQFYNHTDEPCRVFGLSNKSKVEVCEYPDSEKVSSGGARKLRSKMCPSSVNRNPRRNR